MGWRIVQQPNGMLARFSEIVDHFTAYNMTYDEAIEECCQHMGRIEAPDKVQRGIDAGIERFEEAIEIIEAVHGKSESDQYRALLSQAIQPTDGSG